SRSSGFLLTVRKSPGYNTAVLKSAAGFFGQGPFRSVTFVTPATGPRAGRERIMDSRDARLLEQYCTLEYILLGDLRDILEEPPDAESRKWLMAVLDALLDTLPREFGLEEIDGYMTEVLERYPSWTNRVERLHSEHELLFSKLKELRGRVERDIWVAPIANEVRRDLRDWILKLVAHNRGENRLLQTAMNLEVGAGD